MTDEKPPADDAARAAVESGSFIEPAGAPEPAASVEPGAAEPAVAEPARRGESEPTAEPAAFITDDPGRSAAVTRDSVTVRRSPRYGRFMVLGIGAGAIVTFVLTNLFEIDPEVGFGALFGYLLLFGVPIGAALGGLLAVLIDAVTSRRARTVEAERTTVDPVPEDVDGRLED